jgi:hypothetical protein
MLRKITFPTAALAVCALLIGLCLVGTRVALAQRGRRPAPPPAQPEKPPEPTRLRVDVFFVDCTPEQAAAFSLDDVRPAAGDPAKLLGALQDHGDARLLYRIDEELDWSRDTDVTVGTRAPIVQSVTVSKSKAVPSVSYHELGCTLAVAGHWKSAEAADARIELEVSDVSRSAVDAGSDITLPTFAEIKVKQSMTLRDGAPLLSLVGRPDRRAGDGSVESTSICVVRIMADNLSVRRESVD